MTEHRMVELRVSLEINGRKMRVQIQVEPELWGADARYRDAMKANLLRKLGDGIVAELAPEVEVVMPGPTWFNAIPELPNL